MAIKKKNKENHQRLRIPQCNNARKETDYLDICIKFRKDHTHADPWRPIAWSTADTWQSYGGDPGGQSLTKHVIYQLLAKYNITWSRISHPVAVVVGQLELGRDLPMQFYTCMGVYTNKAGKSKSAMMLLQAEWA